MIDRQNGLLVLACDECQDELEGEFEKHEFQAMIAHAKAEGWSIKPDNQGGWWHTCPDCAGTSETPLERARRVLGGG